MKFKFKFLILVAVLFSFNSCISYKFKGKKSPKKYYEVFFIDQGINQYFIKPLKFEAKKEYFTVDFTFRDSIGYDSYVTTNYSIFTSDVVKTVDSAFFVINTDKILIKKQEKFFIDLLKDTYQIRYSGKITYKELISVTENDPEIWTYYNGNKHIYYSNKKAKIGLEVSKNSIIKIIELNKD